MISVEEQLKQYYVNRECPTDSEEYQSSLDIYLQLRSLLQRTKIDMLDVKIIDCIMSGYSFRKTAQMLGADRRTVKIRYGAVLQLLEQELVA